MAFSVIFLFVTLPVSTFFRANEKNFDENRCYFPAIEQLRVKFPKVDLMQDSLSASPPGYTQLLAGLSLISGDSISWLRFWHNLISCLGAVTLLSVIAKFRGSQAALLLVPAVLSTYYLKQACVLSTDNISLICAGTCLGILLFQRHAPYWCATAGLLALLAIYFRQITAWILVPITLAIFMTSRESKARRVQLILGLALASCLGVLGLLFFSWNGMVSPQFQTAHAGLSLSGMVYGLCLLAIFSPFFFNKDTLLPRGKEWTAACYAGLAGILIFSVARTSWSNEDGRWGGVLWSLAKYMPTFSERSIVLLPFAVFGSVVGYRLFIKISKTDKNAALIWVSAALVWLASSIPNAQVFHRYFESPILLFLGLAGCFIPEDGRRLGCKLLGLCCLLLIGAILTLYCTDNGFPSGPLFRIPRP
jgi:hypothetical protein